MKKRDLIAVLAVFLLSNLSAAWADPVIRQIYYQKKTTLTYPKTYTMRFSLWDAEEVGTGVAVWSEQKTIQLTGPKIVTSLGDNTSLDEIDFSQQLWIQVDRWKGSTSSWVPVGTRDRLQVVPYAMWSQTAGGTGDVTSVTAGSGLTGGGTGDVILNVGAGTGIAVEADSIRVNFAGSGTATTAARSDHVHDGMGDVTGVIAGTGLTGGGTSGDVAISLSTPVALNHGGTGATTASGARTNIGAAASGANSDITSLSGLSTPLSISQGGTGSNTKNFVDLTNAQTVGGAKTFSSNVTLSANLNLPATTPTTGIIRSGANTLIHTYGTGNFFSGVDAGNLTMTGTANTGSGAMGLHSNTTGSSNTAAGASTLSSNTSGTFNTAIGASALSSNTTASKNTAVGASALYSQSYDNGGTVWDSHNTAVGFEALYSNQPTSTGWGYDNTALGSLVLRSNTTGRLNTGSGKEALYQNTTGTSNTAYGAKALACNTTAHENTAVGYMALYSNTGGSNVAVGSSALNGNTTGQFNTAVGAYALGGNTTGNFNTAIGEGANVSSGNLSNATAIGYFASVNASNKVRIGNSSVTVIEGQVGWSSSSDLREKKDIREIAFGLDFIKTLRPVEFRMIGGNGKKDFGFIGQEIDALLGREYNILSVGEDEDGMLSLRYSDFIAPMVKAIQEQQQIIEAQQATIEELRSELRAISSLIFGRK